MPITSGLLLHLQSECDGTVDSNVATVSITVTAVNSPPVANAQAVITPEDTAIAITLTGSDLDQTPDLRHRYRAG